MALEQIMIEGFLGKDPVRPSENYRDLVTFSVAVSQSKLNKNTEEWESTTTWYKCNSWNTKKSDYLMNTLKKGDKVVVIGKPIAKAYTSKEATIKALTEILISSIVLMQKNNNLNSENEYNSENPQKNAQQLDHNTNTYDELDDEIPF